MNRAAETVGCVERPQCPHVVEEATPLKSTRLRLAKKTDGAAACLGAAVVDNKHAPPEDVSHLLMDESNPAAYDELKRI